MNFQYIQYDIHFLISMHPRKNMRYNLLKKNQDFNSEVFFTARRNQLAAFLFFRIRFCSLFIRLSIPRDVFRNKIISLQNVYHSLLQVKIRIIYYIEIIEEVECYNYIYINRFFREYCNLLFIFFYHYKNLRCGHAFVPNHYRSMIIIYNIHSVVLISLLNQAIIILSVFKIR